ncbi:hypothetical protein JCM5350_007932 [Sporobolomyces pararoseus]
MVAQNLLKHHFFRRLRGTGLSLAGDPHSAFMLLKVAVSTSCWVCSATTWITGWLDAQVALCTPCFLKRYVPIPVLFLVENPFTHPLELSSEIRSIVLADYEASTQNLNFSDVVDQAVHLLTPYTNQPIYFRAGPKIVLGDATLTLIRPPLSLRRKVEKLVEDDQADLVSKSRKPEFRFVVQILDTAREEEVAGVLPGSRLSHYVEETLRKRRNYIEVADRCMQLFADNTQDDPRSQLPAPLSYLVSGYQDIDLLGSYPVLCLIASRVNFDTLFEHRDYQLAQVHRAHRRYYRKIFDDLHVSASQIVECYTPGHPTPCWECFINSNAARQLRNTPCFSSTPSVSLFAESLTQYWIDQAS